MSMNSQEREVIQNLIDRLESKNAGSSEQIDYVMHLYLKTWIAGPLRLLLSDDEYIGEQMRTPTEVALSMSRR